MLQLEQMSDDPGEWELTDYEWDPMTGLARVTRERRPGVRTPDRRDPASSRAIGPEVAVVYLPQPSLRRHAGWAQCPHVRAFVDRGIALPVRRLLP